MVHCEGFGYKKCEILQLTFYEDIENDISWGNNEVTVIGENTSTKWW